MAIRANCWNTSPGEVFQFPQASRCGADYLLRPWLLVGALVQFDYMDESSGVLGYRIDGRGWMAGPYVELRITQNVILDLKGLGGRSHNEISPILTFADSFSTTRWLASARLTGSYRYGNWHFSPRAQLVGFWENQHAYTDSLGFLVSGQQVSFGRAILGPELSYKHLTRDGILVEPRIAVKGLWTFAQSKAATVGSIAAAPLSRFIGRLELGLKLQSEKGTRLEFAAASDGLLGNNDLRATTGTVQLTIPFN